MIRPKQALFLGIALVGSLKLFAYEQRHNPAPGVEEIYGPDWSAIEFRLQHMSDYEWMRQISYINADVNENVPSLEERLVALEGDHGQGMFAKIEGYTPFLVDGMTWFQFYQSTDAQTTLDLYEAFYPNQIYEGVFWYPWIDQLSFSSDDAGTGARTNRNYSIPVEHPGIPNPPAVYSVDLLRESILAYQAFANTGRSKKGKGRPWQPWTSPTVPNYVDPDNRTLTFCPFGDAAKYWDCDDQAWLYCKLQGEDQQDNVRILFLKTYSWHHALVLQRFCEENPDGSKTCQDCLIEPSESDSRPGGLEPAIIYCWDVDENDPLTIPRDDKDLKSRIDAQMCRFYGREDWGLNCDSIVNAILWRYRIRACDDAWDDGLINEGPWFDINNEEALESICKRLDQIKGVDACALVPECCQFLDDEGEDGPKREDTDEQIQPTNSPDDQAPGDDGGDQQDLSPAE